MKFIFKNIFFLSLLLSTLLFVSCGKESSSSSDSSSETPSGPHSGRTENQNIPIGGKEGALSTLLESESVNCSDPHSCNESVGKIIISIENGQQTCSGVLVSRNKVLTSASCLTKELRKSGIDCKEDIGVIFPETISRPEYKIKCQTILIADDVDDERDPASYKSDLALLELEGDVPRKFANISSGTFLEEESYISWQVVQDVKGQDYLTTQSCLALSRNVALPAFTEKSSALWSVGNCFHDERALGSPIFDAQGNVIGINSKLYRPSDRIKNVFNSISREGRSGPVSFAIPLACHALVTEEIRKSEGLECVVNANFQNFEIDALRLQILEDESLHEENKNMVLESLKDAFKYTKMTFDFFKSKENDFSLEVSVKSIDCFKNPNSWIEEFQNWRGTLRYGTLIQSYPSFVISTHLDGFLRPYSALERGDEVEVSSTFGPKFLMRNGYSYIRTKTSLFGQEREVYNPSAEVCQ